MEEKNKVIEVRIDEIVTGERIRKEPTAEELATLKESIRIHGLLQPIVINQEKKLIAGYRRYKCCEELGLETAPARQIQTTDETHESIIELLENLEREDFTFSDKMAVAEKIEPEISKLARERTSDKEPSDIELYGVKITVGATRDYMAQILKFGSGKTYDQAKEVWKAQDVDVLKKLDEKKMKLNRAYKLVTGQANKANQADEETNINDNMPQGDPVIAKTSMLPLLDSLEQVIKDGSFEPEELAEAHAKLKALLESIESFMGS